MSEPTIILPAPWGAAAVLGLIRAIPQGHRSNLRGRVAVEQMQGHSIKRDLGILRRAALIKGKRLDRDSDYPWLAFIEQGVLGSVMVVDGVDLRDPVQVARYDVHENDHCNLGEPSRHRFPWALVICKPICTFQPAPPKPAPPAQPAQPGLFA